MWGNIIINELVQRGVTTFIISPGSRSTPLTLAVARHPAARSVIAYDERAAAYHAIGYARATSRPGALICTSGTAAANYLPAIAEASNDAVPLIAITADRPPELHAIGANQTMDQQNLYGSFVRRFINIPPEAPGEGPVIPREAVATALAHCLSPVPGPVHINCMFREPFLYDPPSTVSVNGVTDGVAPELCASRGPGDIDQAALRDVLDAASAAKRAMLVVGYLATANEREAAAALIESLGWPTWVDIRSGLHNRSDFIGGTCALAEVLSCSQHDRQHTPDFVLHLGGNFVSKALLTYLSESFSGVYVKASGMGHDVDPTRRCSHTVTGDITAFSHALSQAAPALHAAALEVDSDAAIDALRRRLDCESHADNPLSEPTIGYLLSRNLPQEVGLVMGNSMPVRFCDAFAIADCLPSRVAANRGVSGIDGTLATAIGFCGGLRMPVVCVLGDLSFIHDMNSLTQLGSAQHPVIILVVNNQGGGIFHHLPIAEQEDVFERFFVTPHTYQFDSIAAQFGVAYARAETNGAFTHQLASAMACNAHAIIELTVDQHANMDAYHRCGI